MDGDNGIEVYKYITENRSLRDLVVVMMCTPAQKKEIQQISPTLNTFLLKPVRVPFNFLI